MYDPDEFFNRIRRKPKYEDAVCAVRYLALLLENATKEISVIAEVLNRENLAINEEKTTNSEVKTNNPCVSCEYAQMREDICGIYCTGGFVKADGKCERYKRRKSLLNPIIDWTDAEVWEFIKAENIPYCGLYDLPGQMDLFEEGLDDV